MDELTLQELLDALAREGADVPALLAGIDPDVLARLETEALAAFEELRPSAEASDEGLEALEALAAVHEIIRTEQGQRDQQAAERAERVAALAGKVNGEGDPGNDDDDDGDDGDTGDGDDGDDGDTGDGDTGGDGGTRSQDTGDGGGGVPAQGEPAKEPVLASTARKRVDLAAARRRTGRPALPSGPANGRSRMHAAADLPGVPLGAELDLTRLATAASTRFSAMAATGRQGVRHQIGLASITREYPAELTVNDGGDAQAVKRAVDHATDTSRLPGGSLVAAGGWCAPSETIYDIATFSTKTGLLSVPEITIRRGGVRWPQAPDFSDVYANTGFSQTEAQNVDGEVTGPDGAQLDEKPCYEIGCPDFDEVRLDAVGLCITAGILQSKGYPEMVSAILSESLNAHAHKVNAEKIRRMAGLSDLVPHGALKLGVLLDLLDIYEMHAEDVRYRYRLDPGSEIECVLPLWVRGAMRTDLQRRNNLTDPAVADAALISKFNQRGINVQFVYDWQDAFSNAPADADTGLFGGEAAITQYPAQVEALLYPAGTFLVANDPIITLDGIYDSVNIKSNGYTALFSEESLAVAKKALQSRRVRVALDRRLPAA